MQSSVSSDSRPVIGISCNRKDGLSCIANAYFRSVVMAGGAPVLLPVTTDFESLAAAVEQLDGLILSGGGDIDPAYLGEEPVPELGHTDAYRDEYDFIVLRLAFNRQLPVFGICRGHQVINVAFGGTLYQDINTQYSKDTLQYTPKDKTEQGRKEHSQQDVLEQGRKEAIKHSQKEARDIATHTISLIDIPSRLRMAFNCPAALDNTFISLQHPTNLASLPLQSVTTASPDISFHYQSGLEIPVNSFHHQAVKEPAPEFIITAISPDGLIEAMEHPIYSIFSVQWHPESMAVAGNETMLDLFRYHVRQASVFAKAKLLHHRMATIDSHTDTPMTAQSKDLGKKKGGKVNLPLMREGLLDSVFMVAYIPQKERDADSLLQATLYAEERLSAVIAQAKKYSQYMEIAKTPDDLWRLKQVGKKAIFLGIENGYAIGKNLDNLKRFKELGVVYLTLCHNGNNDVCDSAAGTVEWGGLSPFGKEVVAEMNSLGLMIDVSHAADSTFYDVLKYSAKPVIASHSAVRALCNHPRNLDDYQLRALASNGGVIQLCLYKPFINEDTEKASLNDAIRHLFHIIDIAGINHVGIGSDFDGDGELIGCRAANELMQITLRLISEGFDDESIAKIWGGNLMRVMKQLKMNNEQ